MRRRRSNWKEIARVVDAKGIERQVWKLGNKTGVTNPHPGHVTMLSNTVGPIIGKEIRRRRLELGMTMGELGLAIGIRTKFQADRRIGAIERQYECGAIKLGTLYAIAEALGCEARDLLPDNETLFRLFYEGEP